MKVIKRDGSTVDFDRSKISKAIKKANEAVDTEDRVTDAQIDKIVDEIANRHRTRLLVEDIQDMVEEKLMERQKYRLGTLAQQLQPCQVLLSVKQTASQKLQAPDSHYWKSKLKPTFSRKLPLSCPGFTVTSPGPLILAL